MRSSATSVEAYLGELPDDRRQAMAAVRDVIVDHLPDGFVETMNWGMISYEVPLEVFSETYNAKPLMYAALASQKRHMAVYLTAVCSDDALLRWFTDAYKATGKKLDMGKSCVRFKALDDLPLDLVGEAIAKVDLTTFLKAYQEAKS